MMTFCAKAIITPTSDASIGFRLPRDRRRSRPRAVSPKPENSTLPSERFIAFAMSCVSSVPAEPTTVPAMIIAALSSTKPSNATARPVSALYKRDDDRHVGAADRQRHADAEHERQHEECR